MSTGILSGGVLSIPSTTGTTFDISAGKGYIINNNTNPEVPLKYIISWDKMTGLTATYLTGGPESNIAIDIKIELIMGFIKIYSVEFWRLFQENI